MNEEVLGSVKVSRITHMGYGSVREILYFTTDRMVVARISGGKGGVLFGAVGGAIEGVQQQKEAEKKGEQYNKLSLEDILKADKNNYAVPNSEIIEVELKKDWRAISLNIKTTKKYGETKWHIEGLWNDAGEEYGNMLRPIFAEKLIVKK
jgi:hypothetical protein